MDSLTQIVLGAAVGQVTAGRQLGRRALAWGAICGTLPDLDVFLPLGDAVREFTYHRSFTHSLLVLAATTPLLVWLILKLHPATFAHRRRWLALVYLVFSTHVLLDCFTVYGTQIWWPLATTAPVAWSSIFVIDPLYTLPLLAGLVATLASSPHRSWGHAANTAGLALSSAYLMWSVGAKLHVEQLAHQALANQQLGELRVLTTPTPFNTLLWRILAIDGANYYEAYYSVLDSESALRFVARPRELALLERLRESWPVQRLQWFTHDFYAVSVAGKNIIITDLRMGLDPDYVFAFKVGELGNPHARPAPVERITRARDFDRLHWVWARIGNPLARE